MQCTVLAASGTPVREGWSRNERKIHSSLQPFASRNEAIVNPSAKVPRYLLYVPRASCQTHPPSRVLPLCTAPPCNLGR